jgi:phenylpyruvate tautomerase PptA (4-oxalocrotonate tautomerase family)
MAGTVWPAVTDSRSTVHLSNHMMVVITRTLPDCGPHIRCIEQRWRMIMPLWKIYHPEGAYTAEDKAGLSKRITELYAVLPKFYVVVIFQEVPRGSVYVGGKAQDNFIRLVVDHIARRLPDDRKSFWLDKTKAAIAPFVGDRGYDWELHIDETPFDLWLIQGYRPPQPNSEDEKRWALENRPSPLTGA